MTRKKTALTSVVIIAALAMCITTQAMFLKGVKKNTKKFWEKNTRKRQIFKELALASQKAFWEREEAQKKKMGPEGAPYSQNHNPVTH